MLVALAFAAVVAEPEADANADPLTYGPLGHRYVYFGKPHPYKYVGYYAHPYVYGHYLGKRSADAEPTADAKADPAVVYHGVAGVYGLPHLGPLGHPGYAIVKPTEAAEEAPAEDTKVEPVVLHPGFYGHPAYPHAISTVLAKPDAKVVVPGTVGHPGYPYAGVLGHSRLHYLVRRDAEAEPEANAAPEADAWYGHYYGHRWGGFYGYPYRYGGYYPYGHRYWW